MRISTSQIYQQAITNMTTQQEKLAKLQEQLQTGLRVQTPADDPIAAAQIELMNHRLGHTELLQKNRQAAESSLQLQEGVLSSTIETLQRLRVLQLQSATSAVSAEDRKSIAVEIKSILNQLQDFANYRDSNMNYLFSGGQSSTPAVSLNASGQYVYNGDSTQRFQAITGTMQMAISDTGDNLFMRIRSGNGQFNVTHTATPNTGSASLSSGAVIDANSYIPDDYTLHFENNSQGKLVVMVAGTSSGNVIPPSGLADDAPLYEEDASVSFNGMEIKISGTPQVNDSFAITPAKNESIFSTTQRIIANLNKPFVTAADKAATQTENNQVLEQLDSAMANIERYRSDLGSRLKQLDLADQANSNLIDTSKEVLGKLRDADPTEVATLYNLQIINLQAAQQSFVRIQGLSVFNYI